MKFNRLFHHAPTAGGGVKKIIVGLGNPGNEYCQNRHNIGFTCVNRLAKDIGASFDKKEGLARTAHGKVDSIPVVIARPQTYMNLSGQAVIKLVEKYRLSLDDLIVIHDDMDLRLGQIRIRKGGRSAGHRGVDSIINELDNENFIRVRVGVGRPEMETPGEKQSAVVDFVLEDFSQAECQIMTKAIPQVSQAVKTIVKDSLEIAMTRFNRVPGDNATSKPRGEEEK